MGLGVAALLVVVVEQVALVAKTPLPAVAVVVSRLWRRRSQVSLARTILSFRRSLTPRSFATSRLTVAITPTQRRSARPSTSAPTTGPAVAPSTPSSAPTALSSTSSTSSATGGSTWTAPWLSPSTPSMMRWQLTERKTLQLLLEETLVVLEDALEETEEVVAAMAEVVNKVVAKEVEEDVQDPEGTRTSKGPPLHR